MDLTSVKYQDSCIYIGLDDSQGREISQKSLEGIKNVYAVYKIIAYGNFVRDTILIRKQDILTVRGEIIVKFELNQLHRPDECELEIISLKFVYYGGKREELIVKKIYSLLEIRTYSPVTANKNSLLKRSKIGTKKNNRPNKKDLSIIEEVTVFPLKIERMKGPTVNKTPLKKGEQINQEGITVLEKNTPLSTVVSEVKSKIERKLGAQTKKLEMDMKQLCYETIDALLTSLPSPEFAKDYSSSNSIVESIHRYITVDLLQKEREEGEFA